MQSKAAIEEASRGVTLNQLRSDARQLYYDWLVLEKQRWSCSKINGYFSWQRN